MRHASIILCFGFLLGPLLVVSRGDDFQPPNWRGQLGSTFVGYEFLTNNQTTPPDFGFTPYGPPSILVTPGPGAGWWAKNPHGDLAYDPAGDSGDGWWNLSGQIDLTLQNNPVLNPHKEVWIQLTWAPQSPGNVPFLFIEDPFQTTPESHTPLVQTTIYNNPASGLTVYHSVYHIDLIPNPPWETIHIRGGVNVDELVVDTICVPEPSTWALIASSGALIMLPIFRRRKG
jgi:hypothetical protein